PERRLTGDFVLKRMLNCVFKGALGALEALEMEDLVDAMKGLWWLITNEEDDEVVEKSHFMVKEGIVLSHYISKNVIEVDKAKVDVIAKLPHPTTVKGLSIQHRRVIQLDGLNFKVNGHRVKNYFGEDVPKLYSRNLKTHAIGFCPPVFISSASIGNYSMEDEEVPLVDCVFKGALGALEALEMEDLVDAMKGLWWLITNEEDDEVVVNICREFIGRKSFGNGINLN
nr:reverse transcriptase domain-containing protein [Tanacetum cinerariifolium]